MVVGTLAGDTGDKITIEQADVRHETADVTTAATNDLAEEESRRMSNVSRPSGIGETSSTLNQGETTMSKIKAVATAIAAVFTAAPLAAENDGDYQFIMSGDPVAAATEGS